MDVPREDHGGEAPGGAQATGTVVEAAEEATVLIAVSLELAPRVQEFTTALAHEHRAFRAEEPRRLATLATHRAMLLQAHGIAHLALDGHLRPSVPYGAFRSGSPWVEATAAEAIGVAEYAALSGDPTHPRTVQSVKRFSSWVAESAYGDAVMRTDTSVRHPPACGVWSCGAGNQVLLWRDLIPTEECADRFAWTLEAIAILPLATPRGFDARFQCKGVFASRLIREGTWCCNQRDGSFSMLLLRVCPGRCATDHSALGPHHDSCSLEAGYVILRPELVVPDLLVKFA